MLLALFTEYRFYHAIFPEKCQLSKKESSKIMMTDPFVKDNGKRLKLYSPIKKY